MGFLLHASLFPSVLLLAVAVELRLSSFPPCSTGRLVQALELRFCTLLRSRSPQVGSHRTDPEGAGRISTKDIIDKRTWWWLAEMQKSTKVSPADPKVCEILAL